MKYLTFTVPCYNSQDYMKRCINSLLVGGPDVEIILIDDGSTDHTAEIADQYAAAYPDMIKVIHKENGGHGSGVNKGIELASGLFFKVVDSDDWLDSEACLTLLSQIKAFCKPVLTEKQAPVPSPFSVPDLIVCNYIYDHFDEGIAHTIRYQNVFPKDVLCNWNQIGRFHPSQYLVMHALIFRTEILRQSKVHLPEHTFYVDNLFAYQPLPYVRHIYYMDLDLYHYYIGREDQSVNEKVLMKRIDQQIQVTQLVAEAVDLKEVKQIYPRLAEYMVRNISIMLSISSIHLLLIATVEAQKKRETMWKQIRDYDRPLYYRLRCSTLSGLTYLPGQLGGKLTIGGYRLARKIYRFQ